MNWLSYTAAMESVASQIETDRFENSFDQGSYKMPRFWLDLV